MSKQGFFIASVRVLSILLLSVSFTFGQNDRSLLRKGNKDFKDGKYNEAEIKYRKALQSSKEPLIGNYNLGDALYKQKKWEEASKSFGKVAQQKLDKNTKSKVLHNLGNSLLEAKQYEKSIDAFKQALKNSPGDMDTKYNLAYAQAKLQQQKQQQQQQQQNQDQQKQQQQQNKQQQNKDEKPQEQPSKISKSDAERILEALNNKESELQKKSGKKESGRMNIEKDW